MVTRFPNRFGWKPAYHLQSERATVCGPGDPAVSVAIVAFGRRSGAPSGGIVLSGSVPLGDAGKRLGMGHPMLMAGIWTSMSWRHLGVAAKLGYGRELGNGRALGPSSHHAGHGSAPGAVVNLMTSSEITGGISSTFPPVGPLRFTAGASGAVPMAGGSARAILTTGLDVPLGRWDAGIRAEATAAGSRSLTRLIVTTGYAFR